MLCRHMVAWRSFVYNHNLYSIGRNDLDFWRCSPAELRRCPSALHRIMDFANRDLSVMINFNKQQLLEMFVTLQSLLQTTDLRTVEFLYEMRSHLGPAADQFVHELRSFAYSPFDSLISFDCNTKYEARKLTHFNASDCGLPDDFELLQGIYSLPQYVRNLQYDDDFDVFSSDFDVEDEDADVLDDYSNMSVLQAPVLKEMRRIFKSRSLNPQQSPMANPTAAAVAIISEDAARILINRQPAPAAQSALSPPVSAPPAVSTANRNANTAQQSSFLRSPIQLRSRTADTKRRSKK
ncbi:uncharacterized protein LOC133844886 isoform X2 [Drosophila sulfurigaster albostrigata]|uniref:uncharacterized protein LOC133844886 isoform X2 n=1 Tax=Drosophila sulfurigaster albostrigata TaxID=89887 RepID=UPI002D21BAE4|nr:uncharacterized protein LOC133844886 isoform X2 [Drosophila sulfurigaster albostrigata]